MKTKLRAANKGDLGFVTANWANVARNCPQFKSIPNNTFYFWYQKMMEQVIPRSTVLMLCVDDPEVPDDRNNIAFVIYEKTADTIVLHYAFCKKLFRGQGFMKKLWAAVEAYEKRGMVVYTLCSKEMMRETEIANSLKERGWLYNPFELWDIRKP